jgi:hypothetical protein
VPRAWAGRDRSPICPACRLPYGLEGRRRERHHGLKDQIVRREGGNVYDVRNRWVICSDCHERHTNRSRVLPAWLIPDSVIEFAVELLGPGKAFNALTREYEGDDVRLQALLRDG